MSAPNRNLLWAGVFVDELARSGLRAVCIAPGSRSTPLAVAFAQHPDIQVYSLIDERSAAFFALGLGLASGQPAAVLCSSGTATANFHPAVIEAYYAHVPLLVLTADRPPELRDSGANQTIDQVKMYGDHVLWAVDAALPESDPAPLALRSLRTLACRAYATAAGIPPGPVHLNFPFRKPLEPVPVPTDVTDKPGFEGRSDGQPFTRFARPVLQPPPAQTDAIADAIRAARRGIIVCGVQCPGGDFPQAVAQLAQAAGYPIFADAASGVRFGIQSDLIIGAYDSFVNDAWFAPDLVLHFGAMPTSGVLETYFNSQSSARRIAISDTGVWSDASHRLDDFLWAESALMCRRLAEHLTNDASFVPAADWLGQIRAAEENHWRAVESARSGEFFDGLVLADVVDLLPPGALLFVGNSLPVRHLDQFGKPGEKALRIFANRGASGIDGVLSSALGAAAASDQPLTLVIGDLSFYHDMNGLMAIKRLGIRATIVLLNNDGGGIFNRLPIAQFDPPFTELFITPHGLDFEPAVRMYGLEYSRAHDRAAFRQQFAAALSAGSAVVIEVPTDGQRDLQLRRTLIERIAESNRAKEHTQ